MASELSAFNLGASYNTIPDAQSPVDAEDNEEMAHKEDVRVLRSLPKWGAGLVAVSMVAALTGTSGAVPNPHTQLYTSLGKLS